MRQMISRPDGTNPLIYTGSVPSMTLMTRRPTVQDGFSWPLGYWWIIPKDDTYTTGEIWILVSKADNINVWKKLHGGGGPTPPGNIISVNKIFLTTPGAGTYTPTAGMSECYVECVGGGGGGNASAAAGGTDIYLGGGAAGGYSAKLFTASEIGASQAYVVGAGGSGGVAPAPGSGTVVAGSTGGATTFGSYLTANGGAGGSSTQFLIVSGGSATGGDINISGQDSGFYLTFNTDPSTTYGLSGYGGSSIYGQGGAGLSSNAYSGGLGSSIAGLSGTGYGSGPGGAICAFAPKVVDGTAGQSGIIIITEYIG